MKENKTTAIHHPELDQSVMQDKDFTITDGLEHLSLFTAALAAVSTAAELEKVMVSSLQKLIPFRQLILTVYTQEEKRFECLVSHPGRVNKNSTFHFNHHDITSAPFLREYAEDSGQSVLPFTPAGPLMTGYYTVAYLFNGKNLCGGLFLFHQTPNKPDNFQLQIISIISGPLAMAINQISYATQIAQDKRERLEEEEQRALLLAVSNELFAIRTKADLLRVLNHTMNKILHYTHSVITLSNSVQQTYTAFLRDHQAPSTIHPDYNRNVLNAYPLNDAVMTRVRQSTEPVIFDLGDLRNKPAEPGWLKMSYESGTREIVVMELQIAEQHFGAFFIHSNEKHVFKAEQLRFIKAISYQLANVVSNIVSNREIIQQEYEKSTLLSLSNQIAAVRSKNDLLDLIQDTLKKLLPISHTLTAKLTRNGRLYRAYIVDSHSPCREHKDYTHLIQSELATDDFVDLILMAETPLLFNLEEVLKHPYPPAFLKLNYECGIRQVICSPFGNSKRKTGFLTIFVDPATHIQSDSLNMVQGAAAQLSTAIANIIANEEILEGEKEKSSLLMFSNELAGIRDKTGLTNVISKGLKNLFQIGECLLSIKNKDHTTQTFFLSDEKTNYAKDSRFELIREKEIVIEGHLSEAVFNSPIAVSYTIDELIQPGKMKMDSAGFWKSVGVNTITGVPLSAGDDVIGALWIFNNQALNERLMSAVSSLIAVAMANTIANEKIENQLIQISGYKQQLEVENRYLQEEIQTTHNYSEIVGNSAAMTKVFEMVSQVSATESSVLILGETGTGKELIARALHNASTRKNKLMVKVNCATLPPNLIESELFGHERGSFTGAVERRIGKFELANNSTLFLDEIGELPLDMQVKLLRALQEREIERVGGQSVIKVNVRIIAATNRNLHKEVQNGNFRSDLFFRLNVFPIILPALRDRREDIPLLSGHFLLKYARKNSRGKMAFSNKAVKELMAYHWPGNVRELEHLIERSILITEGAVIQHIHLPQTEGDEGSQLFPDSRIKTIDEIEREHIISVLKKTNGRVAGIGGAAKLLKIPSTTLNSKIKRLHIKKGLPGI